MRIAHNNVRKFLLFSMLTIVVTGCGQFEKESYDAKKSISREEALALGSFSSTDRDSFYIIATPHGGFDRKTAHIVDSVSDKIQWDCLIARNFRTKGHPINVNRPTERYGVSMSMEEHTDRALYVYEEYLNQLNSINRNPKLYVEIHGNSRGESRDNIEIATVNISTKQAKQIKTILQSVLFSTALSHLNIAIENIDDIYFYAASTKTWGVFSEIKPALHFEFPRNSRINDTDKIISFLEKALPALADMEIFK